MPDVSLPPVGDQKREPVPEMPNNPEDWQPCGRGICCLWQGHGGDCTC